MHADNTIKILRCLLATTVSDFSFHKKKKNRVFHTFTNQTHKAQLIDQEQLIDKKIGKGHG